MPIVSLIIVGAGSRGHGDTGLILSGREESLEMHRSVFAAERSRKGAAVERL